MGTDIALIVEDNALLQSLYAELAEDSGFAVDVASDGIAALKALARHENISVLITDYNLGGSLNGINLAHRVRSRFPQTKVIIVSGSRLPDIPPDFDYLMKPFSVHSLTALVEAVRQ